MQILPHGKKCLRVSKSIGGQEIYICYMYSLVQQAKVINNS